MRVKFSRNVRGKCNLILGNNISLSKYVTRVSVDSNSTLSSFKIFFPDYLLNKFFLRIREKKKLIVQAHREMKPRNNRAKLPRSTFLKVGFFHVQFFRPFIAL